MHKDFGFVFFRAEDSGSLFHSLESRFWWASVSTFLVNIGTCPFEMLLDAVHMAVDTGGP